MLQKEYPTWRLYGEFLVPHSLKTYEDDAWRKFYIFDVFDDTTETFIPYEEYQPVLEQYELDYIPVIATLKNATPEKLLDFLEKNVFLIRDGCGYGEGLVVKRYDYVNKYGRTTWAKVCSCLQRAFWTFQWHSFKKHLDFLLFLTCYMIKLFFLLISIRDNKRYSFHHN